MRLAAGVAEQVAGRHVLYAAFIDIARRDMAAGDQVAQPLRRERVELVVIGCHELKPPPDLMWCSTQYGLATAIAGRQQPCHMQPSGCFGAVCGGRRAGSDEAS